MGHNSARAIWVRSPELRWRGSAGAGRPVLLAVPLRRRLDSIAQAPLFIAGPKCQLDLVSNLFPVPGLR